MHSLKMLVVLRVCQIYISEYVEGTLIKQNPIQDLCLNTFSKVDQSNAVYVVGMREVCETVTVGISHTSN